MDQSLIEVFLPEGLLDYFKVTSVERKEDSYQIRREEKDAVPQEYSGQKLLSKGFYEEITVQDFPIRGKACYLKIRRRRWKVAEHGKIISRDWAWLPKGGV